jgi:hypothetical protein
MLKNFSIILLTLIFALSLPLAPAHAQDSIGISITPPLFKVSLSPGDHWASSVKVMNVAGANDIVVYASVVDFEPQGENGQARFIPPPAGTSSGTPSNALSGWITVPKDGIVIHPAQSAEFPFSIAVPAGASPGGHYAAILIGTKAFGGSAGGATVNVASYISSLIFVRIAGDVHEEGLIKEFSVDKDFSQKPDANFSIVFQNTGNVDLVPQGAITIYNMWGKERGTIPVNQQDDTFGNVLPNSARKFDFHWEADAGLFDFGRFTAVATLGYGEDSKQNVSAEIAFWVIPVVPMTEAFLVLFTTIFLCVWCIRRYVGRVLRAEMAARNLNPAVREAIEKRFSAEVFDIPRPGAAGSILDLRGRKPATRAAALLPQPDIAKPLFKKYLLFLVLIPVAFAIVLAVYLWLK